MSQQVNVPQVIVPTSKCLQDNVLQVNVLQENVWEKKLQANVLQVNGPTPKKDPVSKNMSLMKDRVEIDRFMQLFKLVFGRSTKMKLPFDF